MPEPAAVVEVPAKREAPSRVAVALTLMVVGLVLVAQVPIVRDLLDPAAALGAAGAKGVLKLNALLAAITVLGAALLPMRLRGLALLPGALVAAGTIGGLVTVGGHLWDVAAAVLTVAGSWWAGRLIVRMLRAQALQDVFVVELVVGLGVVGLGVLALGRLDILAWWSAGAIAVAIGAVGLWTAAGEGWRRRETAWSAVTGSRLGTACAGLLLLQLGWAVVWLSAPEIMYDALSAKAYLPELWAQTGSIGPLLAHPMLNVTGLAQVVAVPGHTLGAPDVGRELQALGWVTLVATTWWLAGSRSAAGPLAALLVGVVPQLVWESTTAYDDIVLALGVMALAVAVLRTTRPTLGAALAIGLLTGTCVWLKLNMLALTAVLAVGWVLLAGSRQELARRFSGVGLGALAVAGPALALRWIDTGNPVFPTYNTIFKSPHYPLVNEQYDFPFWPGAGLWDAVRAPYEAVVNPSAMTVALPPGTLGVLIPAVVLAVLLGWRRAAGIPDRRSVVVVWIAVVVSLLAWWVQFRYLRYLLPTAVVSVVLVLTQLRGWHPHRRMTPILLIAAAAAGALYLPSTVANYWNVPKRDLPFGAAFGRWDKQEYLRAVFPEADALNAFQRAAGPGATAVSSAHERTFLHDREISAPWEVARLLELSGPLPTAADDALQRLRRLGIGWALITDPDRSGEGTGWLDAVIQRHGELTFGDHGWDLYRLVDRPPRPRMLPVCDPDLRGRPGCWTGTFDAASGLADGESAGGAHRVVAVCPGQAVAVQLRTAAGGQAAHVWLDADGGNEAGHTSGTVPPGRSGWVYGTVPPGARTITVTIGPGIYGGTITRARIGLLGRCASNSR